MHAHTYGCLGLFSVTNPSAMSCSNLGQADSLNGMKPGLLEGPVRRRLIGPVMLHPAIDNVGTPTMTLPAGLAQGCACKTLSMKTAELQTRCIHAICLICTDNTRLMVAWWLAVPCTNKQTVVMRDGRVSVQRKDHCYCRCLPKPVPHSFWQYLHTQVVIALPGTFQCKRADKASSTKRHVAGKRHTPPHRADGSAYTDNRQSHRLGIQ